MHTSAMLPSEVITLFINQLSAGFLNSFIKLSSVGSVGNHWGGS